MPTLHPEVKLTPRWTPLRDHPIQLEWMNHGARFNVVPAGRRSGKTERVKRKWIKRAFLGPSDGHYFFGAPTRDQAKRIFWEDLKKMIPTHLRSRPMETELSIRLINGALLFVVGMDKPARMEGTHWDGGALDEIGNMKKETWPENIRPALSTEGRPPGECDLIGVPEGRNHYFDHWTYATESDDPNWAGFTWFSADIISAEEIAAAKRELDELTFRQEYEGSFVNFVGQAYYPFDRRSHCGRIFERYNPDATLIICFDFNVDPGVAVMAQEMGLPIELPATPVVIDGRTLFGKTVPELVDGTGIVGEVHIPQNSNTPAVCKKIIADWGQHRGRILVYGDATGGARGTAQTEGSDWDLVRNALYGHFGPERVTFRVPDANPTERARVNAVNSRLMSADGTVHIMVDPVKAPQTVKDFEGVRLLEGGSGEVDKKRDPDLSHLTDGFGYYIVRKYPTRPDFATSEPLRI